MADIVKRNGGAMTEWDPMRMMREMLRWDPFRQMAPAIGGELTFSPSFEVTENADAYLFKADLPGVNRDDIAISVSGNRIQISGKRDEEREEKEETVYTYERQYGSFMRSFTLPDNADLEHAKSELKDGVLTLAVPKKTRQQPKKIAISTGSKS